MPLYLRIVCALLRAPCDSAAEMLALFNTVFRSLARNAWSCAESFWSAQTADKSLASLVTESEEGFFAPSAAANKSFFNSCFCSGVTDLDLMVFKSAAN